MANRWSSAKPPPQKSRRDVIVDALEKSQRLQLPGKPIQNASRLSPLQLAAEIVRRVKEPAVGGMTKLLYRLPPEEQRLVKEVVTKYADQRELGRYGDPQRVLTPHGVSSKLADAVTDAFEMDYVAAELQRRHRKDNSDLELPELDRRDYINGAIDAHTSEHE